MIRDLFLWLLTSFVVEPMQAEWNTRLAAAGTPPPRFRTRIHRA